MLLQDSNSGRQSSRASSQFQIRLLQHFLAGVSAGPAVYSSPQFALAAPSEASAVPLEVLCFLASFYVAPPSSTEEETNVLSTTQE
jgi:hypothetical protein